MIRLAIPLIQGCFSPHFGRCDSFYVCDIAGRQPERPRTLPRPRQRCEAVPDWLKSLGVNVVLTQGIGAVALDHLTRLGMLVLTGGTGQSPEEVVQQYLSGWTKASANTCRPHQPFHCRAKRP